MKVRFIKGFDDPAIILEADMTAVPNRNEMLVINEVVYECSSVKHVFNSTGRRNGYEYVAEVRVWPV